MMGVETDINMPCEGKLLLMDDHHRNLNDNIKIIYLGD